MDFSHLSLQQRKRLFMVIVAVTGIFSIVVWLFMLRGNIATLSGPGGIKEIFTEKPAEEEKNLAPSIGQIFGSYIANIWDGVASIPSLFEVKEVEISREEL
ncbi:MAG: hypothetical protein HZA36_03650 [Parcubacteria group bacterium]|nr:hypothetical protein [Parcubacteria group bacterium]